MVPRKTRRRAIAILGLTLTLAFPALSRSDVVCNAGYQATVKGEIGRGDFDHLVTCLDGFVKSGKPPTHPWGTDSSRMGRVFLNPDGELVERSSGWVSFNSEGGDVNEAMKIGRFLREGLAEVAVPKRCFSACFFAIVGAVEVHELGGRIGIHRPYIEAHALKKISITDYEHYYNNLRDGVWRYLLELDVPTWLIEKMFSLKSSELYVLTNADIKSISSHPAYDEWISARCPPSFQPTSWRKSVRRPGTPYLTYHHE